MFIDNKCLMKQIVY